MVERKKGKKGLCVATFSVSVLRVFSVEYICGPLIMAFFQLLLGTIVATYCITTMLFYKTTCVTVSGRLDRFICILGAPISNNFSQYH